MRARWYLNGIEGGAGRKQSSGDVKRVPNLNYQIRMFLPAKLTCILLLAGPAYLRLLSGITRIF